MQSVYNSGWFQELVPFSSMTSVPLIFTLGIVLSQFISNVPFIALFQPVIITSGLPPEGILALAAGSTIAGNLTILGAASNVIVLQQAEKVRDPSQFPGIFKTGLPLTLMQGLVYLVWLTFWVTERSCLHLLGIYLYCQTEYNVLAEKGGFMKYEWYSHCR